MRKKKYSLSWVAGREGNKICFSECLLSDSIVIIMQNGYSIGDASLRSFPYLMKKG